MESKMKPITKIIKNPPQTIEEKLEVIVKKINEVIDFINEENEKTK